MPQSLIIKLQPIADIPLGLSDIVVSIEENFGVTELRGQVFLFALSIFQSRRIKLADEMDLRPRTTHDGQVRSVQTHYIGQLDLSAISLPFQARSAARL